MLHYVLLIALYYYRVAISITVKRNFDLVTTIQSQNLSIQTAFGSNSKNIETLLDSKLEENLAGFLSSTSLSYAQSGLNNNKLLHFTLMKNSSILEIIIQDYISLASILPQDFIFYNSKIVTLSPLFLVINYSKYKIGRSSDSTSVIHLIELNYTLDIQTNKPLHFSSNCNLYLTDVQRYLPYNEFVMITNENCKSTTMNKSLFRCDLYATFTINECKIIQYYLVPSNNPNFLLSNQLISFHKSNIYSSKFVFVGLSEGSSSGDPCSNSFLYENMSSPLNSMFFVDSCSDYSIKSYTRFTFLINDEYLVNIGSKCSYSDLNCVNGYISFYIYHLYGRYYRKGKVKLTFDDKITQFLDAILSLNN